MASTADFRVGMVIRFNGELHRIEEYIHRTPGNLRAFVQAKLRGLKSGRVTETRFRSGEEVEEVRVEQKEFQYLFHDGASYQFMDKQSYEQMPVDEFCRRQFRYRYRRLCTAQRAKSRRSPYRN